MKKLILFLFITVITGCNDNEKEPEYYDIKIEEHYSFFHETKVSDELDEDTLNLFNNKVYSINSIEELNKNPLFQYCSAELKDSLRECNFEKYTLCITGSYTQYEFIDLKSISFGYNNFFSEYVYNQILLCKAPIGALDNTYLIIDIFSTKKIPNTATFSFGKMVGFRS